MSSTFQRIGPDFNSLLNEPDPQSLTDQEILDGLDDGGQTGTRTARIQTDIDGNIIAASNTGLMTAQQHAPRSNAEDNAVSGLQKQYDQIAEKLEAGLEDGLIVEGDYTYNKLLAEAADLEEQAQSFTDMKAHSNAVHVAEREEASERQAADLQAELAEQEAAREADTKNKKRPLLF